jgi:hypothetical protein
MYEKIPEYVVVWLLISNYTINALFLKVNHTNYKIR